MSKNPQTSEIDVSRLELPGTRKKSKSEYSQVEVEMEEELKERIQKLNSEHKNEIRDLGRFDLYVWLVFCNIIPGIILAVVFL